MCTRMRQIYVLIFVFLYGNIESQVITLQHGKNVTCVLPEISTEILTLDPPTSAVPVNVPQDINWEKGDWEIKNENGSFPSFIDDKRWEDFAVEERKYNIFHLPTSVSLSVYFSSPIYFYIDNGLDRSAERYESVNKTKNQWIHYNVLVNNQTVLILENNAPVQQFDNISTERIVVRAYQDTFWKIHNYTFMYAEQVSKKPTYLNIPSMCMVLYTSMCDNCYLEINNKDLNHIVNSRENQSGILGVWKQTPMELRENEIRIERKTYNDAKDGYWAIDIRLCTNVAHFVTTTETQHICKIMNKENSTDKMESNCPVGYLGKSCNISCGSVLGPEHTRCEGYRICENNICTPDLNYYYTREFCQTPCPNITLEIGSCINCNDCKTYGPTNGFCTDSTPSVFSNSENKTVAFEKNFSVNLQHSRLLLLVLSFILILRGLCYM